MPVAGASRIANYRHQRVASSLASDFDLVSVAGDGEVRYRSFK
jgi:hypothetical protein